ncbi:MAG: Gx transporter family protein [Clostridia bacterium]|nr:Gx transporter family protein [Clostridia bacterium]
METRTKRLTFLALGTSLAMVLSYVELIIPPISTAVPGVKMGLANIVIVFILYKTDALSAAAVSAVRLILSFLLFGSALTLAYSVAGAVLSLGGMVLLKKTKAFSPVGVSVAGGVLHNAGQIAMAILIMKTSAIGYYLPVLAVSGTVSGILVGAAAALVLKNLRDVKI